jgi:hypothetical protein
MPARDQLQPKLALAQARLAGQQHAHAEDVHEHAVARGALGKALPQVGAQHVDHMAGRLGGHEQRDLGAVAHCDQAVRRRLAVGDDQKRRFERDDAGDPAVDHFRRRLAEIGHLAPAHDLHPVGVDVVEIADQVGGRPGVAHRGLVEAPFGMGVAGHPLPAQGTAVGFEQRFRADGGGLHALA